MKKARPEVLNGRTTKVKTNCGSLYLTLNEDEGELCEIRVNLGKSGNCVKNLLEINSILMSIIMQVDLPKEKVIKIFERHCLDTNCGNKFYNKGVEYKSCIDYVAKEVLSCLKKETEEKEKETK
jgi:ribonucleoside-diphosphate reductase alpha chain